MTQSQDFRFLIIQTAFLGDVTLSLGMAEYLKEKQRTKTGIDTGKILVDYVTTKEAGPVAKASPFVDDVFLYDKRGADKGLRGLWRLGKKLRQNHYHAVFIPHRFLRSSLLAFLTQSPFRIGFDIAVGSFLFTHQVPYPQGEHEILKTLRLVRKYFHDEEASLILPTFQSLLPFTPHFSREKIVALAPGSVWKTKRWPPHQWAKLISHPALQTYKILLIGGKNDQETGEEILSCLKELGHHPPHLDNRIGKDNLQETFQLLSQVQLLICNDSGPQHFALALRTPVIAIFGPTVKEFGYYPIGERDQIIEPPHFLSCRPCGSHGSQKCPLGTHECMESITVDHVLSQFKNWQNQAPQAPKTPTE